MKKRIKITETEQKCRSLTGISSLRKDFQLAWILNNTLGFDFKKIEPQTEDVIKDFSIFEYSDDNSDFKYILVSNKNNNRILDPKYANIDFFLISDTPEESAADIVSKLNRNDKINGCFILKFDKISDNIFSYFFEE